MPTRWPSDADAPPPPTLPRARRRRPRGRVWRVVRGLVALALTLALLAAVAVAALWPLTPGVADAGHRVSADLASNGARPLAALPQPDRVGQAIIATENSRFYADPGLDPLGLLRAAQGAVTGENTGAATLEQQLTKRLWTPGDGGLWAKVEDAELALKLDVRYPKDQILRMYLSDVYFGHGHYGLTAAARGYFGLSPDQLDWAQASLLAGLVQAPTAYDPYRHLTLAKQRQRHVLDRLVATHRISAAEADAAYAAPLHLR